VSTWPLAVKFWAAPLARAERSSWPLKLRAVTGRAEFALIVWTIWSTVEFGATSML
jgi:hypothetical protein